MMVQPKADGMALMIEIGSMQVRTRAGQDVSLQMKEYLKPLSWAIDPDDVWFVEVNIWNEDFTELLPRPESNGILNAIFKTGRQIRCSRLVLTALDAIPVLEFYGNIKPTTPALERYNKMLDAVCDYTVAMMDLSIWPQLDAVPTEILYSPAEAREYCQYLIANGGEGAVIKDPKAPHKNGKSGMKLKNEFECTLRVVGHKPHSRNPEWVGSLLCESADGKISTYVGSGLNEEDGSDLDRRQGYHAFAEQLVEVKAEKISKNHALDLPRITGLRFDKDRADTFEEVQAALADSQSINNC
jgi:ATP-dependent DNA ligase